MKDVLLGIQKWAKKLNYPINSFSDLARQAQKNPITIEDKEADFANIKGVMPAYYFPIASFENLMEKTYEIIKLGQQQSTLMTRPSLPGVRPEFMPVPPSSPRPFTAAGSQIPPSQRPPSMPM